MHHLHTKGRHYTWCNRPGIICVIFIFPYFDSCLTPYFKLYIAFIGVRVTRSLVLCVMFCRSLFVLLSFSLWSLCCLSFFDFFYGFRLSPFDIIKLFLKKLKRRYQMQFAYRVYGITLSVFLSKFIIIYLLKICF